MFRAQRYLRAFLIPVFFLIVTLLATAAPQTFTGVVSDTMCGAKHMLPGKTDAECTRECIKAKGKYALVVDKKVFTLVGSEEQLSALAGRRVRVAGEKSGDNITVKSVAAADK